MNFPFPAQPPTDDARVLLDRMIAMLGDMASASKPIDEGSLSLGFFMFMLEQGQVTEAEGKARRPPPLWKLSSDATAGRTRQRPPSRRRKCRRYPAPSSCLCVRASE